MNEYPKILKEKEKKQDFNNNFMFGNDNINNKNSYTKIKENKFAQNEIYFNNYNKNYLYEQSTASFNNFRTIFFKLKQNLILSLFLYSISSFLIASLISLI